MSEKTQNHPGTHLYKGGSRDLEALDDIRGPEIVEYKLRKYMAYSFREGQGRMTLVARCAGMNDDGYFLISSVDDPEEKKDIRDHFPELGWVQPIIPMEFRPKNYKEDRKSKQT